MTNVICEDHNDKKKPCYYYAGEGFCMHRSHWRCIEFIRRKKPIISASSRNAYVSCKYKWYHYWYLGMKLKTPKPAPTLGSYVHAENAIIHSIDDYRNDEFRATAEECKRNLIDPYSEDGELLFDAQVVPYFLDAYRRLLKEDRLRWFRGRAEVGRLYEFENITLKAIIDLIIENEDGHVTELVDYKYTSKPDSYDFFTTRVQAAIYLMLQNAPKITFRIMRKPKVQLQGKKAWFPDFKQGKNETQEELLDRIRQTVYSQPRKWFTDNTYHRSEYDFKKIMSELETMASDISRNIDNPDFFWQATSEHCMTPWACDFLDACKSGAFSETLYEKQMYELTPEGQHK